MEEDDAGLLGKDGWPMNFTPEYIEICGKLPPTAMKQLQRGQFIKWDGISTIGNNSFKTLRFDVAGKRHQAEPGIYLVTKVIFTDENNGWIYLNDEKGNEFCMRYLGKECATFTLLPHRESDWMKMDGWHKQMMLFAKNHKKGGKKWGVYYEGEFLTEVETNDDPLLACAKAWLKAIGDTDE